MRLSEDKSFAILRIIFGFVWLVDAYFKWNPTFFSNFTSYLSNGAENQPALVQAWINLWIKGVSVSPHFFAIVVALCETLIAICLLLGLGTKIALSGGMAMTMVIWSTAEGFGGPYTSGSTDIGAAVIYFIVFLALWLGKSWRQYSLDSLLYKRHKCFVGRW